MNKFLLRILFLACLFLMITNLQAQNLVINEFMASNDAYLVDPEEDTDDGDPYEDWIEIYNAGTGAVDVGGMYVTDDLSNLTLWQIPATDAAKTTIAAGGYLILYADKETHQGVLHVNIKLSGSGEQIGLTASDGVTILDSLTYTEQIADTSYGRTPDGADQWAFFPNPTPGAANGSGAVLAPVLYINEFLASNDASLVDPDEDTDDGDPYEDWIEIFNPGSTPVDIGGMYITDDLAELTQWQIPATEPDKTTIPAGGFLVLYADKETHQGVLHVNIKLSGGGEQIGLTAADGTTVIDSLTYTEQYADTSYGRTVDGGNEWAFFIEPTPGASNVGIVEAPTLFINEFMASNDTYLVDPEEDTDDGDPYEDWIEIYNPGAAAVDIGGMYITDDLSNLTQWQIPTTDPAKTTIPAGGFLLLYADKESHQGVLHVDIKLSGGGEQIGLTAADGVTIIDSLTYTEQIADTSYGRVPDGGSEWAMFANPTPGTSNPVSAVSENGNGTLPVDFALMQNYPNPFNPSTTIVYQLPKNAHVFIKVYNIVGREITTLVNSDLQAGTHKVQWNGHMQNGQLAASGVYFYRIQAGEFTQVKKMMFVQ
ncbi:MAG: lamin tail domain-containing protein [Deferribacteres bacterium]|nr:lamin tail domain-containing protein [candidate division KSB1 bacterium]MCB9504163.1 lamin tail domain-containing protein [Deferribacteres bacterium]